MDWNASLQNSYVDDPVLNVNVLSDKAFKELIKVKWGHQSGTLIQSNMTGVLGRIKGETLDRLTHREQAVWANDRKTAVRKAKKRDLRKNQICRHLDLGLPTSRIVRKYSSVIFFLISTHMCIYLFIYKYIHMYTQAHTHTHICIYTLVILVIYFGYSLCLSLEWKFHLRRSFYLFYSSLEFSVPIRSLKQERGQLLFVEWIIKKNGEKPILISPAIFFTSALL